MEARSQSRRAAVLAALAAACALGAARAQGLANELRRGDDDAVQAADAALREVDPSQLGGLMTLLRAGAGEPGASGVAAELAFAVLGWWSLQDAGTADRLYDACTEAAWAPIGAELLDLASIGAADGTARAKRWIARDEADWRRQGWWLLRMVGADAATLDQNLAAALTSDDERDQLHGLLLMWEFEVASPTWTERLERLHAAAQQERTRQAVRWALARTGGFRTRWMLDVRAQLDGSAAERWFDARFERMVPRAARRLARELPKLGAAERAIVAGWLSPHLGDTDPRRIVLALDLAPAEGPELFAAGFAEHARDDAALLGFWAACLRGDVRAQRLGCLGLAHAGDAAAPHLPAIAALARPGGRDTLFHRQRRAAALYALGAAGPAAAAHVDVVADSVDDRDEDVAAAARWALPRLRGEAAAGPWRADDRAPPPFRPRALAELRAADAETARAMPGWPAAARRLALPRLLLSMLQEVPLEPPERPMAFGLGATSPMARVTAVDPLAVGVRRYPDQTAWPELYAVRAEALRSLGADAKVALPLLQWLAPRRPFLPPVAAQLQR